MKLFVSFRATGKLFFGLFFVILILAVVFVLSYTSISGIKDSEERLYKKEFLAALAIRDIRASQNAVVSDLMGAILSDIPSVRGRLIQDTRSRAQAANEKLKMLSLLLKDDPALFPKLDKFIQARSTYVDTRNTRVIPLINAGKMPEAKKLVLGTLSELNVEMQKIADDLIESLQRNAEARLFASQQSTSRLLRFFLVFGFVAFGLCVGTGLFMYKVIVDKERGEEKLRVSSTYARSLLEASLDPLVTISPEGKITDVNEAAIRVTGLSRERLIGTDFSSCFTEPDKASEGYRRVFEKGFVTDYPLTIRHTTGKLTDVLYNASVYKGAEGNILGVFAAARDTTERNRMEEELRAASLYSRSLLEASLDPLVTISPEGKITDVNKATEMVTGVSRDSLIGSDFSDYFTEPDKAREGYQKVISQGFVRDYPLTIKHTSGRLTYVLYNAAVYTSSTGKIQGVFAAARDITERKQAEEGLRALNQQVQEAASVLASSVGEILTLTTELASISSETAASVSETTSTVEEVKQTAQLSAEKSRSVSEGAQRAASVAQQGNAAVVQTVEGINHIKNLMESVARSIMELSEQSKAIGEIMAVVSDLSQQSNLLSVNAAIEAAKAGEYGKGFSVVAQEIKSLADQSKDATSQVRGILADIQKATGASVLAAEQVSKAVESGAKQAAESGEAIRKLAQSIEESAYAATQIAATNQQQFAGMDQITQAMESIKQASQQNVAGVKQAEQAAYNLNELGKKLKEMVSRYKV